MICIHLFHSLCDFLFWMFILFWLLIETKPVSSILASFSRCNKVNKRQGTKKWAHIMFIDNQKKRVLMHCDTCCKTKSSIIVVVTNDNFNLQSLRILDLKYQMVMIYLQFQFFIIYLSYILYSTNYDIAIEYLDSLFRFYTGLRRVQ